VSTDILFEGPKTLAFLDRLSLRRNVTAWRAAQDPCLPLFYLPVTRTAETLVIPRFYPEDLGYKPL